MSAIFKKLNLKDQTEIVVLNAPASFEPELTALAEVNVQRKVQGVKALNFALAFVTKQAEVDALAAALAKRAQGDALLWFAYPKGSSKQYKCEFNRDTGWAVLGELGYESVRMVAIDEDWSALRFRRTEFVKTMKRAETRALSAAGKAKVSEPASPVSKKAAGKKAAGKKAASKKAVGTKTRKG